jgi:hypothetical protein
MGEASVASEPPSGLVRVIVGVRFPPPPHEARKATTRVTTLIRERYFMATP